MSANVSARWYSGRGAARRLLEARDGRLRGEALAVNRIAIEQQLVNGILGERITIIAVGMAARQAEHVERECDYGDVAGARERAREFLWSHYPY